MKRVVLVLLLSMTISCSPLSLVKDALGGGSKPGISVDTELTVGDKKEEIDTDVQVGDKQTAKVINNNQKEEMPLWVILLLILGWILPSPQEIYRELKNIVGSIFDRWRGEK